MKLGTQTASVVNHLMSRSVIGQPEPVVGMGATILSWTDRHAATIFRVFQVGKATYIETRDDNSKRVDSNGMSEIQRYEFKTNPNGRRLTFRREPDGKWTEVRKNEATGRWIKLPGYGLSIGERAEYYDFSF